jgi:hypothetical protein
MTLTCLAVPRMCTFLCATVLCLVSCLTATEAEESMPLAYAARFKMLTAQFLRVAERLEDTVHLFDELDDTLPSGKSTGIDATGSQSAFASSALPPRPAHGTVMSYWCATSARVWLSRSSSATCLKSMQTRVAHGNCMTAQMSGGQTICWLINPRRKLWRLVQVETGYLWTQEQRKDRGCASCMLDLTSAPILRL